MFSGRLRRRFTKEFNLPPDAFSLFTAGGLRHASSRVDPINGRHFLARSYTNLYTVYRA